MRAMSSVVLNLAEGNARKSTTERRRFFEISRASASEVSACLDLMFAFGLINKDKFELFKSRIALVSKMLWGLMR